jgi:hypothetical protein
LASSIIICHAVRPAVETEVAVTKSIDSGLRANSLTDTSAYSACATVGTKPKIMRKGRLIEKLEEAGVIDHNLSVGAKIKIKGLLNPKFQKQKSRIK